MPLIKEHLRQWTPNGEYAPKQAKTVTSSYSNCCLGLSKNILCRLFGKAETVAKESFASLLNCSQNPIWGKMSIICPQKVRFDHINPSANSSATVT